MNHVTRIIVMKQKSKILLIISIGFLFIFAWQASAINPEDRPWNPPPQPSYGTTSNSFTAFDSGNVSSGQRCDHSVGGPGKDCYFTVDVSNIQAYQAFEWKIAASVDQAFNTTDSRSLGIDVCTTMGTWGQSPLNCWSPRSSNSTDPLFAGWTRDRLSDPLYGQTTDLGTWTSNATSVSVHVFVKNVYANFTIKAYGRRAHIDSFTANGQPGSVTVTQGQRINLAWSTTNVPNGGGFIGTGNLVDAGSYGAASSGSDFFIAGNPGSANIQLQMQGPGGTRPAPTTVVWDIPVTITAAPVPAPTGTLKATIPLAGSNTVCTKSSSVPCDVVLDYTTSTGTTSAKITKNASLWRDIPSNRIPAGTETDSNPVAGNYTYTLYGSNSGFTNVALDSWTVQINPAGGGGGGTNYTLTVLKDGFGSGTVTSTDNRINCGSTCSYATYASGTSVSLKANPSSGSVFVAWANACSGTDKNNCVFTMDGNKTVTGMFDLGPNPDNGLSISKVGTGKGRVISLVPGGINCGNYAGSVQTDCSSMYSSSTTVNLKPQSDSDTTFASWGGDCSSTPASSDCSILMSQTRSVTATFNITTAPIPTADIQAKGNNPDTGSFVQGPLTIPYNTSATLKWDSTNVANCPLYVNNINTGQAGASQPSVNTGNITIPTSVYEIRCVNQTGGPTIVSDSVTINVTQPGSCSGNCAQFVSQTTVSTPKKAGDTQAVTIVMKNTGTTTWTSGGKYNLGSQNRADNSNWGLNRVALSSVSPGGFATFPFLITMPAQSIVDFQWRMVQDTVEWFGDTTANQAVALDSGPGGGGSAPGEIIFKVVYTPSSGTLNVSCNNPPGGSWIINPGSISHTGPSSSDSLAPGSYSVTFNPAAGYNTPAAQNSAVAAGSTSSVSCTYTLAPPAPVAAPKIIAPIDNSICGQLKVNWQDNSNNEDGFKVMRSTSNSGTFTQVGSNLAANTTTYTDQTVSSSQTYYYQVTAFANSPSYREATSTPNESGFNGTCSANFSQSSMVITFVTDTSGNRVAFTPSMIIKSGYVLTFQIAISNVGNAPGNVQAVTDQITTSNLTSPANLKVDVGNGAKSQAFTDNTPPSLDFGVSGIKCVSPSNPTGCTASTDKSCKTGGSPSCNKWTVDFDLTYSPQTTSTFETVAQNGFIRYTDGACTGQGCTITIPFGPILVNTGTPKVPNFREVAP